MEVVVMVVATLAEEEVVEAAVPRVPVPNVTWV
jgi:hypothetical protein